ncbi:LysE family translocator [Kibdelosporangium phytohabitans]|uniref:Lysine transporter LysE n=1 Tax=Kibdelosporangium phytohabitans TaxID=860235 RepID=A0A0N9HUV2_9PSEU|nr:LysE family translocator [Kibdelosporangium phytohabitans]ALG05636.1 lysine transporter LysE [Kibdelosporangium phytohabitans]MBE1466388.1 RhtB (resistance to homoserine/threonine) family protein [Kibdelosporangium phytohabitans]
MLTGAHLLAFMGVVLLAAMSPGPDFVIVTRHAAISGKRAGMAAGLGIAGGVFVWALVAALGVASLLAASAIAYTVVKLIGAAYLAYLGVKALIGAWRRGERVQLDARLPPARPLVAFRQGLITNLLNPKCAVFFVALMPQFLPGTPTLTDTLMLSAVTVLITITWFTVLANLVGLLKTFFTSPKVRKAMDTVTGTILIAFGLKIATD